MQSPVILPGTVLDTPCAERIRDPLQIGFVGKVLEYAMRGTVVEPALLVRIAF
jgi:hypothetical protein